MIKKLVTSLLSIAKDMKELSSLAKIYRGPIAVYQMGKVGSETILFSLQRLGLPNKIYHIHVLYQPNLDFSIQHRKKLNLSPTLQMEHSRDFKNYLDQDGMEQLRVITSVREPVAQLISSIFQNLRDEHPEFLDSQGNWKINSIKNHIYQSILNYNCQGRGMNCNWFDNEFNPALKLDVYQEKFNQEKGFSIVENDRVKALVLQVEKSENWSALISSFLDLRQKLEMFRVNDSQNKSYREMYKMILSELSFPKSVLERIYSSKYCRHFYTDQMIGQLIEGWS